MFAGAPAPAPAPGVTESPTVACAAAIVGKDPRHIEVVLSESSEVIRTRQNVMIVAHRLGFVMANAGIDRSNVPAGDGADEAFAARKHGFEAELEAKKVAWRKEQEDRARTVKEADEAGLRARKREAEEYGYETERRHKADADGLAQTRKLQAAELDASKEQHERSWAERELALAKREQEYAELKARAAAAPKDLEAAVAKAEAEGVGIAKRQAKIAADLQQKTNEGKKRVYELRVAELDSTISKQNEQINELSKQLATALKQAQDLAIKAIDGASNSNSFAAVKEIALEQAKTSQKTK